MGRTGAAPRPTALKLLHGDRPARINTAEPVPRNMPPAKPGWLSPLAAEEWDRIAPDVEAMRTVKAVDSSGLAAYCEAVARLRAATAVAAKAGPLIVDRDGKPRTNPAVRLARDASYEVRMWAREFGFTPSARAGIVVDVRVRPADSAAGRLLS